MSRVEVHRMATARAIQRRDSLETDFQRSSLTVRPQFEARRQSRMMRSVYSNDPSATLITPEVTSADTTSATFVGTASGPNRD